MKQRLIISLLAFAILTGLATVPGRALAANMGGVEPAIIAQDAADHEEDASNEAVSLLFIMIGLGAVAVVGAVYVAGQRSANQEETAIKAIDE